MLNSRFKTMLGGAGLCVIERSEKLTALRTIHSYDVVVVDDGDHCPIGLAAVYMYTKTAKLRCLYHFVELFKSGWRVSRSR